MLNRVDVDVIDIKVSEQLAQLVRAEIVMRQALLGTIERDERARLDLVERRRLIPKGGHRHKDEAAGFQHARHLGDKPPNRCQAGMVNHLDGNDRVEKLIGVRQRIVHAARPEVSGETFGGEPVPGQPGAYGRVVEAADREAKAGEVHEMPARPASEIQNLYRI